MNTEILKLIQRELDRHEGLDYHFSKRRKHPSVVVRVGGRSRFWVFTSTRTDRRGMRNAVTGLRRVIRQLADAA